MGSTLFATDHNLLSEDPVEALRRAFVQTEDDWLKLARTEELFDGTTAAVALVNRINKYCVVGNVGDSEVILCTQDHAGQTDFRVLTEVHHVKRNAKEAERILATGGRVWKNRLGHPKINPQCVSLAISRAIGDLFFKDDQHTGGQASGLTAEPYITTVQVCGESMSKQCLLIGCDGFWDTVTYKDAADFVLQQLGKGEDPQTISEALVRLACD